MISFDTIRELADRTAPDRCFVSLYHNGAEDRSWLDRRLDASTLLQTPTALEAENLEETLEMVREHVRETPMHSEAEALFACWADDYLETVEIEVPVEPRIVVDSSPFVLPLAEIADEFETWCVALVDHDAARLFEISGLEIEEVDRAAGDITNHVKAGGWSQQRYERRREKQIDDFCDDIADRLDELVGDGEPCDRLVLSGDEQLLRRLEDALPPRLQKHLVGSSVLETELAANDVFDALEPVYEEAERADERELLDAIQTHQFRDGRAAIGPGETLDALRSGRVQTLLIDRESDIEGVRCRECEWLHHESTDTCPVCEGETFEIDLDNELVELASRTDAAFEVADPMDQLSAWGGVAALLRY
jgi:peptide chain release factor subunit 1